MRHEAENLFTRYSWPAKDFIRTVIAYFISARRPNFFGILKASRRNGGQLQIVAAKQTRRKWGG